MSLPLHDDERKLVEGMLAFANMREITSTSEVESLFWQPKYARVKEEPHHCRLLQKFHQPRLRAWLDRIKTEGSPSTDTSQTHRAKRDAIREAERNAIWDEIAYPIRRVRVYLALGRDDTDRRRLSYDFQIAGADSLRVIEAGYLTGLALVLDHSRSLIGRLHKCGWSKCGRFNLKIDAVGRPPRFCLGHKKEYDRETSARRVEAWRDKNHPNRKRRKKQEHTAVEQ